MNPAATYIANRLDGSATVGSCNAALVGQRFRWDREKLSRFSAAFVEGHEEGFRGGKLRRWVRSKFTNDVGFGFLAWLQIAVLIARAILIFREFRRSAT